ncbi:MULTISPECIES: DMT family transporter [Peptostreptococcales]|uniref:DMT family transporter n=1 Tax=Peptostreptococcales TaxID=3082720 RepID=UPI000E4801FB|nr:DMT family transporter [Peptoclostridium sp. AF21-18]RHQ98366.1 EamA family transporter [Peptoclostridium sp. AF21-18]
MKKGVNSYVFIAMAGILWSTLGLFGNMLMERGLSSEQVAFTRLFIGFIVLSLYSLIRRPEVLKINLKCLLYCGAIGIICQGLFNKCYFKAVEVTGVSIAAVLLYTSPLFLAVFSKIVYKEKMTRAKIISLILCCIGAIMAVTGGVLDLKGINTYGIIMGIMAAITYALMPIISKNALKEFSSETILIYGFLFGAIFMIPSAKPVEMIGFVTDMNVLPYMILLGVFPAAMAYIFYAEGIARGCELSIVGVVASVELIAASIIGWTVVGEVFTIGKAIGVAIMFVSAFTAVAGNKEVETEVVEEMEAEAYVG